MEGAVRTYLQSETSTCYEGISASPDRGLCSPASYLPQAIPPPRFRRARAALVAGIGNEVKCNLRCSRVTRHSGQRNVRPHWTHYVRGYGSPWCVWSR